MSRYFSSHANHCLGGYGWSFNLLLYSIQNATEISLDKKNRDLKDSDVHAYHRPREFAKRVNELYIFFNAILTMCIVFANVSNCIDTFPD